MPINIGNCSLKESYVGSTALKEIYIGSSLLWSKLPDVPPIPDGYVRLTVHFDFADAEIKQQFKNDNGCLVYEAYDPNADDMYEEYLNPYFQPREVVNSIGDWYIDVKRGWYLGVWFESLEGDYGFKYDDEVDYQSLTENTTLTISLPRLEILIDGGLVDGLSLRTDTSINRQYLNIDLDYIELSVNGNRVADVPLSDFMVSRDSTDKKIYRYVYPHALSIGDVVTISPIMTFTGDDPTLYIFDDPQSITIDQATTTFSTVFDWYEAHS